MNLRVLLISIGAVALAGAGLWYCIDTWYCTPREEKLKRIDELEVFVSNMKNRHRALETFQRQRDAYAARTLGQNVEQVTHRLRTRLNRIVELVALAEPSVTTGSARRLETPARSVFPARTAFRTQLREQADFTEIEATISGGGDFMQVLTLLDMIEAEPWMKRVSSVSLAPRDNGVQFQVTMKLTTLFLTGLGPEQLAEFAYDESRQSKYLALAASNPFHIPPPAPPTQDPAPPVAEPDVTQTPPTPKFPYKQWKVTAVVAAVSDAEVWLANQKTGERMHLTTGQKIGDATFVRAEGDLAWFEFDTQQYSVLLGKTLDTRIAQRGLDTALH